MTDEEEQHEIRTWELYDALMYDTSEEVIECLKKLDRLDREFIEIIIQQLESPNTPTVTLDFNL